MRKLLQCAKIDLWQPQLTAASCRAPSNKLPSTTAVGDSDTSPLLLLCFYVNWIFFVQIVCSVMFVKVDGLATYLLYLVSYFAKCYIPF